MGKINKLELLALTLLRHDLSIPEPTWKAWLLHLRSYYNSPTLRPSPIERPSASDPKTVMRKVIDGLLVFANRPISLHRSVRISLQPVFVGLEERIRAKTYYNQWEDGLDSTDIDLDEDGPLREEYLPQRRLNHRRAVSCNYVPLVNTPREISQPSQPSNSFAPFLPPPAKWSPEADPPIERERDKAKDRYIAVQASTVNASSRGFSGHTPSQFLTLSIGQIFNHSTHLMTSQWLFPPYQFH